MQTFLHTIYLEYEASVPFETVSVFQVKAISHQFWRRKKNETQKRIVFILFSFFL